MNAILTGACFETKMVTTLSIDLILGTFDGKMASSGPDSMQLRDGDSAS
jgi:hypothetical protein